MGEINVKRKLFRLDSGLKVLLFEHPFTKKIYAKFNTKGSTSVNPKGKEGLAHLLEHVMARQSERFRSQVKLAESLETIGAGKGASTGHFNTEYHIAGGVEDGEYLIQVLADIVSHPYITSESVDSERLVIEKEIVRTRASNERLARDLLWTVMFANSPIAYGNLGSIDRLKKITVEDLASFYKLNYLSSNSILGVASGLSIPEMEWLVRENFSSLKKGDWVDPKFSFERTKPFVLMNKDTMQVSIQVGFRFENNVSELYAASVISALLCRGWSSRIPRRLRIKESLIYSWGSHSFLGQETSGIFFHLSTSVEKFKRLQEVLAEEILRFVNEGVTDQELSRAKNFITKPIGRSMETVIDYIKWYLDQELFHPEDVDTPSEYIKNIKAVTASDIRELAEKYFNNDNWYMSVVGNVNEEEVIFQL